MLQQVQSQGVMAKCRLCGALNPNPQKTECWQCHRNGLACPTCREAPILRYDIERDSWKCPSASHSGTFVIRPREPKEEWTAKDKEQWIEGFRKKWEKRKQSEKEEQERSTQRQREEREREKNRKDREKDEEDRRRSEEGERESRTQAERARQAMKDFRIKRQKEHEAERNLHFADGHIEPQDDYPFDPEHPGYYKGEWDKKHTNIISRLLKRLLGL